MSIKPIAYSYWRSIKRGNRKFDSIKNQDVKNDVCYLAKEDVANGEITEAQYIEFIGEFYFNE